MIRTFDGTSYKRVGGLAGDRGPSTGFQRLRAIFTAAGGETSITTSALAPQITYNPGASQITVKRSSGGVGISGLDFFETSPSTIGFPANDPLLAGEVIEITREFSVSGIMAIAPRPDVYTAPGVAGQTLVTSSFAWPYALNPNAGQGGVLVHLNGVLQTRGIDYTEVNLGSGNTNQITFVDPLAGGENIVLLPAYQAIDQSAATNSFVGQQLSQIQASLLAGTQAFVDQSAQMAAPATQIIGRAKIPNIVGDLRASFGLERIMFQQLQQLQNEAGASNEPVFSLVGDDRGLIRFVGNWTAFPGTQGYLVTSSSQGDYVEVTFYGTGLNLLYGPDSAARDYRATVDGGTEGANFYVSGANTLVGRNTSQNQVTNVVAGLTAGVHTVKIRNAHASANMYLYGVEIANAPAASANVSVQAGAGFFNGQQYTASAGQAFAYTSGVTGTRGGRQVVYLTSVGALASVFQATNASAQTLSSADHTNEDLIRFYHYREFGAGRADDWSGNFASASAIAFTLDDGTTSLVSNSAAQSSYSGDAVITFPTNGSFVTFTFVGTGCDYLRRDTGTGSVDTFSLSVDGATPVTYSSAGTGKKFVQRLVSGLPYGTHTVTLTRTSASTGYDAAVCGFYVYGPKKPVVPQGGIELCDFNVMATYAANATAGLNTIGTGVLRKFNTREFTYLGTWPNPLMSATNTIGGFTVDGNTINNNLYYTFFGTGFELRGLANTDGATIQVALQALSSGGAMLNLTTANFGTSVFSSYGGAAFTSSTGVWNQNATSQAGAGMSCSGLPLGLYTLKLTQTSATTTTFMRINAIDVIAPIHVAKSNVIDFGNTLSVGSCSLSDIRQTSMIKTADRPRKNGFTAYGVTSSPSTGSTSPVPCPDMSGMIVTTGGRVWISCLMTVNNASVSSTVNAQVYVDGVAVGVTLGTGSSGATGAGGQWLQLSGGFPLNLAPGIHKIDLYWWVSGGTGNVSGVLRTLSAIEV